MTHAITRRTFIGAAGTALAAGMLLGRHALAADHDLSGLTLNISTYKTAYTQFMVDAGEADTPYKVNPILVPFDVALRSISAGDIDLGANFTDIPLTIWGQQLTGARLVAVADNIIVGRMLALIVPGGSPIERPEQLKGKRIGYLKASNQHYFLLKLLDQAGLTFADIDAAALPLEMGKPAFLSGELDAWITQGPDTLIAQHRYGGRLLASADGAYAGNSVVCAHLRALQDPLKLAAIRDYLQRADRTLHWIQRNPDAWAEKSAALTGIDTAIYREQARQVADLPLRLLASNAASIAQQQGAADYLQQRGLINRHVDVSPLWDPSLAGSFSTG